MKFEVFEVADKIQQFWYVRYVNIKTKDWKLTPLFNTSYKAFSSNSIPRHIIIARTVFLP